MFITLTINTSKTKSGYRSIKKPSNVWRKSLNSKKRSLSKRITSSFVTTVKSFTTNISNEKQYLKTV